MAGNQALPRPQYNRAKSQPEFSHGNKWFDTPNSPVDPRELTRRLEIWLLEEETRKKYNLPRPLKHVQTSTSPSPASGKSIQSSSASSVSSPVRVGQRPTSCHSYELARSVQFRKLQKGQGHFRELRQTRKSNLGIAKTTNSLTVVDHSHPTALHALPLEALPTRLDTVHNAADMPRPPPEPKDPYEPTTSKPRRERPKSLINVPRYVDRSVVLTSTTYPVKRQSLHTLSKQVPYARENPFVLPALELPAPFDASFAESSVLASWSGPKESTPVNPVDAVKARDQARDKIVDRNNCRATGTTIMDAGHIDHGRTAPTEHCVFPHEAAACAQAQQIDTPRACSGSQLNPTALGDVVVNDNAPAESVDEIVKPAEDIPVAVVPGENRPRISDWAKEDNKNENKEGFLGRIPLRLSRNWATGKGENQEAVQSAGEELERGVEKEGVRRKQPAMRQDAVEASKKAKGGYKDWEQLPSQRKSLLRATQFQPGATLSVDRQPPQQERDQARQEPQKPHQELSPAPSQSEQSPPRLDPALPPTPPLEPPLPQEMAPRLPNQLAAAGRQCQPEMSNQNRFYSQPRQDLEFQQDAPISHFTILRSQTEPIPLRPPRNDIATLPSQRNPTPRYYAQRSFSQPPEEITPESEEQPKSRIYRERHKSLGTPQQESTSETPHERPKSHGTLKTEKHKSLFGSSSNQDRTTDYLQPRPMSSRERRRSLLDSPFQPTYIPSESQTKDRPRSRSSEPEEKRKSFITATSGGREVQVYVPKSLNHDSLDHSPRHHRTPTVRPVHKRNPSTATASSALSPTSPYMNSLSFLRPRSFSECHLAQNVPGLAQSEVDDDVALGIRRGRTAPATPGDVTPVLAGSEGRSKSVVSSWRVSVVGERKSRLLEIGSIFGGKRGRECRDEEALDRDWWEVETDCDEGLNLGKRGGRLQLGTGRGPVSVLDVADKKGEGKGDGEKKRGKWKGSKWWKVWPHGRGGQ